jgi:2-oxoglutarate dehydrogenase E2 component (dihydrolipoamide succinyltransferase)
VRPAGFVAPRFRFGHADGNGGAPDDERIPFSRVRARAALALIDSKQTAAHAHVVVPCDYSAVDAARGDARSMFAAVEGFSLTALPFVAVAVCRALRAFPDVNVTVADDGTIVEHRDVALGIAVDLAHTGLVVPVVRDADGLTLRGLARAIHGIAAQARDKKLRPDDLMGGTFTITNPGSHGTALSFPIIHRPQAAILVTDGVHRTVVARSGTEARPRGLTAGSGSDPWSSGGLDIRPVGMLGLGFDHRVIDPHTAGAFTACVRDELQSTDWAVHLR